jgi:hypothetical protein
MMRVLTLTFSLVLGFGLMGGGRAGAQDSTQPPAKTQGKAQDKSKGPQKGQDPNDPDKKNDDVPDPTKDPMKDPALDITRDPLKDPNGVDQSDANAAGGSGVRGADDPGGIQAPDYTGPAILSRGFALSTPSVITEQPFRVYAGLSAVYDSGLIGAYVKDAQIPTISSYGADLSWGASGRHYRRKDIFELNYSGHYYEYASSSKYNGQDHSLSLAYTHEISPHFSYSVRETAGLYSNTFSVLNSTAISDTSLASSTLVVAPNTESFDDRTYYSTTQGALTWHKSPRLSFSISGAEFIVRRASTSLADASGYQATFDASYRITKRQSIGTYYSHSGFTFRKVFGGSNADSVGLNYAISLNRTTDLSVRLGGTRLESQSLALVVPNPLVQAALGITFGYEKFYLLGYAPDVTITLSRNLRKSSLGASFTEGITPGNGLILTSKRQSESVFYNAPTFRQYAVQIGAGRDWLTGYSEGPSHYASYFGRFSVARPVTRNVSSVLNFDYRQFGFSLSSFHQKDYRVSMGLRYQPGEGPLKFW